MVKLHVGQDVVPMHAHAKFACGVQCAGEVS